MSDKEIVHQEGDAALTDHEWSIISRLNQVCVMMARSRNREEVIETIRSEFNFSKYQAETQLRKAEEYMASGAIEDLDVARGMYHQRLTEIYSLAMSHAVKDQVEVITKPMKLRVDGSDETRVINGTQTKVKPNSLDTSALQVALKAAREASFIMGGCPNDRRRGVTVGTVNVQVNNGAKAATTMDMSIEQLAQMVGAEVVDETPGTEILSVEAEGGGSVQEEEDPVEDRHRNDEA